MAPYKYFGKAYTLLILLILSTCNIKITNAQLHRAISFTNYHVKYDNSRFLDKTITQLNVSYGENKMIQNLFSYSFIIPDDYLVWSSSITGAFLVGLSGIVPVILLPHLADDHEKLVASPTFKCFTAFAAGTLLGDVFLHLIPETFTAKVLADKNETIYYSAWLIIGLLTFFTIEKVFPDNENELEETDKQLKIKHDMKKKIFLNTIKTVGLLNLIANIIDNFTHGIAVAGSFQASFKFGLLTLIATLLHEVPHEIGDFVILLKSGLGYKEAAVAQMMTAFAGVIGSIFALGFSTAEKAGNITCWILPFTSGGFLYIALIGIIPEIISESDLRNSLKQIMFLSTGIFVIYFFTYIVDL